MLYQTDTLLFTCIFTQQISNSKNRYDIKLQIKKQNSDDAIYRLQYYWYETTHMTLKRGPCKNVIRFLKWTTQTK